METLGIKNVSIVLRKEYLKIKDGNKRKDIAGCGGIVF